MERVIVRVRSLDTRPFPVDMLRYDALMPATEGDSDLIVETITDRFLRDVADRQRNVEVSLVKHVRTRREAVDLMHQYNRQATSEYANGYLVGRWRSFGWTVVEAHA